MTNDDTHLITARQRWTERAGWAGGAADSRARSAAPLLGPKFYLGPHLLTKLYFVHLGRATAMDRI